MPRRTRYLAIILAVGIVSLLAASPAVAVRGTVQLLDTGARVTGVAVNDSTGNLYALSGGVVRVYDATGAFLFGFGEGGTGAGQLAAPVDIAIDQSSGDVYVLENANDRVSKFDSAGNFIRTWGWDVNQTQAGSAFEICPRSGSPADICQEGGDSSSPGAFRSPDIFAGPGDGPAGIALDPAGNVVVSEPGSYFDGGDPGHSGNLVGNRRIQIFTSSGSIISHFVVPQEPIGCKNVNGSSSVHCQDNIEPFRVAVDSTGTIYTTTNECLGPVDNAHSPDFSFFIPAPDCAVRRFSGSGEAMPHFASSHIDGVPFQIAIDQSNDHVYVSQATGPEETQFKIAVYDHAGNPVEDVAVGLPRLGSTSPGAYLGSPSFGSDIAVQSGTSRAYVSEGEKAVIGHHVLVIDTLASLPSATIAPVTSATSNSATFNGTANPNTTDFQTGYRFEYRAEGEDGWTPLLSADTSIGTGTSPVQATQTATGLIPNTTYHVRLAVNRILGAGSSRSSEVTFTTKPEPPQLSLIQASRVGATDATLQAALDPRHSATTYRFEYGFDESYGHTVPLGGDGEGGSQFGAEGVFERIEGLEPATAYHFRVVAKNQAGEVSSGDQTFKTLSSVEAQWPARGIELVNSPDKGNQHVLLPRDGKGVASDGSKISWAVASGAPGSTTGSLGLFVSRRTPQGWRSENVIPPAEEQVGGGDLFYELIESSADLSRFLFITNEGVLSSSSRHVLVRVNVGGTPETLAALPNGNSNDFNQLAFFGLDLATKDLSDVLLSPSTGTLTHYDSDGHADPVPLPACGPGFYRLARQNGNRLFFLSSGESECGGPQMLYFADLLQGTNQQITTAATKLLAVSPSGEKVLYLSGGDFFSWSIDNGEECLSCAFSPAATDALASADLSHIYFTSAQGLTPDALPGGGIYVWRGGDVSFVSRGRLHVHEPEREHLARVTPDGQVLVFKEEKAGVTADDNGGTAQLYRYEDRTGRTECVSCRENGAASTDAPSRWEVSADGVTVAFVIADALDRRDVNNAPDVYEWHAGRQRLVTDGVTEFAEEGALEVPRVWGISEDGEDLFFSVAGGALTGDERDGLAQLYDARLGGGFPRSEAPAPCVEDACQGPLQATPPLSQPGSAAMSGPSNERARQTKKKQKKKKKRRSSVRSKRTQNAKKQAGRHAARNVNKRGNSND